MVTAAYLSFTIALVVVLLLVWRLRAEAVLELERARADARRGRHAQALAADMANIAQALVLGIQILQESELSDDAREAAAEMHTSVISFTATLRAAQFLVEGEPRDIESNAEGWVRVAVAGARGEGVGVRVGGFSTRLRAAGKSTDVARILDGLILGLGATVTPRGFVQVDLLDEGVDFSAPIADGRPADPRVARAAGIVGLVGWTADVTREGETTTVKLRGSTKAPPIDPRLARLFAEDEENDEDHDDEDDAIDDDTDEPVDA